MPDAAVASASIPMVFPPHVWEGKGVFMDGMTAYNTNVQTAIDSCRELIGSEDDSKITIDVLICEESSTIELWDKPGNSWSNFFR